MPKTIIKLYRLGYTRATEKRIVKLQRLSYNDTRKEDVVVSRVLAPEGRPEWVLNPLLLHPLPDTSWRVEEGFPVKTLRQI